MLIAGARIRLHLNSSVDTEREKEKMMKEVSVRTFSARRFPDPYKSDSRANNDRSEIEHHVLICDASSLTDDIPLDPNPRDQKTNKTLYKEVRKSLIDSSDLTFHLKNKGITILAQKVKPDANKSAVTITFGDGDGIVDGGHTYTIIKENRDEIPKGQYVKLEVLTGAPQFLVESIAQGLNTSVQVSPMSLDNLSNKFAWIKDELAHTPYREEIAYKDNAPGSFTVRDIIALLTLFNIELFPETDSRHPKIAYTSKAECLRKFEDEDNERSYRKLRPILRDILELYDYVQLKANDLYNKKYGGKALKLAFFQTRQRGQYRYIFTEEEASHRIADGALYPILGAFRFLVEDKDEYFAWKLNSFDEVKAFFDRVGAELIMATKSTSDSRDRNPNAIGKDDTHWQNLYKTVALELLLKPN